MLLGAAVALAFAAAPDPGPSPTDLAALDGFAAGMNVAGKFDGVVLVAKDGRPLFEKAYGLRDAARELPAEIDTRFNLASAGKMFTAVAILQLVAAGKLTLDTPVIKVLPDYPNRAFARAATVRMLLTHQAGAGDVDTLFGAGAALDAARARLTSHAAMIAEFGGRAPVHAPGKGQEYGNFGHVILGRMVEVLSGLPFEAYLQQRVFAPAGMTRTAFADCTAYPPDAAVGTATVDGKTVSNCTTQPARGFAAGGSLSTARDMLAFVTALNAGKLLPRALFADATRTHAQFMGLGFFATDYGKDTPLRNFRWGHGGSSDGVCTDVRHYPRTGETVIVLTNHEPPDCFPVAGYLHQRFAAEHPGLPTGE